MKIKLDQNTKVYFPDHIEIVTEDSDFLIFSLYYSKDTGFCLLFEDTAEYDENGINHQRISELTILDDQIRILDINNNEAYLNASIAEVHVYNYKGRKLEDGLFKYNKEAAKKYNLNEEFAFDNGKVKKRQK